MKIHGNDPCPCGSGKKYKKCCLGRVDGKPGTGDLADIMAEVRGESAKRQYSSLAELQAELNLLMQRKNNAPLAEFHGLSPARMHRFLHFPFDSPELARFNDSVQPPPDVPILRLLSLLLDAIGEKGLKATATGNLPQKFCREAALAYWGEEKYKERTRIFTIRTEPEFGEMHCLRLVAGLAGIVRKYKGSFVVTRKCREGIDAHGLGALYPELFRAYVSKFNWAYRDGYEELYFMQQSFLFTLYILRKYGGTTRSHIFYDDIFIKAFPRLLAEVAETAYRSSEETVRRCYTYRVLHHFASFFGLIECIPTSKDILDPRYTVRKLPLLDQLVTFSV
ncbi:MAG: hypothetical protein C4563_03610 [Desulfobulbus sp.]|nr:MAG: hypothetical protein C4563_03610 [Desulfobulbus sp.]